MKRTALLLMLLIGCAGYVFLQTPSPRRDLAELMPGGAALYLEARDFGRLMREWDASQIKADWLASDNYAVFSRSNLFQKLQGVYQEYGKTAGFLPDLRSVMGLAGTESALALYDFREVEFLYITRLGQSQFAQSALAAARPKFEQRQSGSTTFYLRTDPASGRTVTFATAGGYLLLATRDDLVARALALVAGGSDPSIASEAWYRDATAAVQRRGELRLVMNLETLVKSVYFRSYWIQRNVSELRKYRAGIADVSRARTAITEDRVFLPVSGGAEPAGAGTAEVAELAALAPPQAGAYKAYAASAGPDPAALVIERLIAANPPQARDWRYAPAAVPPDQRAGSETDLETHIDEPPMPQDAGVSEAVKFLRAIFQNAGVGAVMQAQSSDLQGQVFLRTPSLIVLSGAAWDASEVRPALSAAAQALWSVSGIGAKWTLATAGRHSVERLDGLGTLLFAARGKLLFLSNDPALLAGSLDWSGIARPADATLRYAAGFRHSRERAGYERLMKALDFSPPETGMGFGFAPSTAPPEFFSGNLASISRVLSPIQAVTVTEHETKGMVVQQVVYRLVQ